MNKEKNRAWAILLGILIIGFAAGILGSIYLPDTVTRWVIMATGLLSVTWLVVRRWQRGR